MNKEEDWFIKIIREMIKNHYTLTNLGKIKIVRQPNTLTAFNFGISFKKSLFEDLLSEEEKSMLWLEEGDDKENG